MAAGPVAGRRFEAVEAAPLVKPASSRSTPAIATVLAPSERFRSSAELENWLASAAIAEYGHLFGQPTYSYGWGFYPRVFGDVVTFGAPLMMAAFDSAEVSSTNVQVEGVDEADLVETDGDYLYIISGKNLVIVEAGVGDALRVVSRTRLDERPTGMYLYGDRLALVSSRGSSGWPGGIGAPVFVTMARDYEYSPGPPTTTVTLFDIGDRAAPTLVQKTELDGQLVTSRTVDGQLRLVLSNSFQLPMPIAKPIATASLPSRFAGQLQPFAITADLTSIDGWYSGSVCDSVYETQAEYIARVRGQLIEMAGPSFRTLSADGTLIDESPLVEARDLYRPQSFLDRSVTTIATFDLLSDEAGPVATASVMTGATPQVYATTDNIYLFAPKTQDWRISNYASQAKTNVWKFAIDSDTHDIRLKAKGQIDGTLLNQFAADEHDGYLRVVTKSDWSASGQSVQVLGDVGHRLKVVGRIDGIAAGERLHSVRFMANRAFLVTFRQVDPLFAVDLNDPAHPTLMGELVIPGVSGYLQPIDENHLLGVGRAMDSSGFMFGDLEVSLFDISDLTNPELLHRYSFEGGWSTTTPILGPSWIPFTGDHHAASYFADEQIFAMPVFSTEGGSLDGVASTPSFQPGQGGLQVFRIDVDAGFTPLAFIQHDTLIERSLSIGDHLFAISSDSVSVHELADPNVELGEVKIVDDPVEQDVGNPIDPTEQVIGNPFDPSEQVIGNPIDPPIFGLPFIRAELPIAIEIGRLETPMEIWSEELRIELPEVTASDPKRDELTIQSDGELRRETTLSSEAASIRPASFETLAALDALRDVDTAHWEPTIGRPSQQAAPRSENRRNESAAHSSRGSQAEAPPIESETPTVQRSSAWDQAVDSFMDQFGSLSTREFSGGHGTLKPDFRNSHVPFGSRR